MLFMVLLIQITAPEENRSLIISGSDCAILDIGILELVYFSLFYYSS